MYIKTIITVQHTQSVHHTNGMVGSWTDWDLTETGLAQAGNIGAKLKAEFPGKHFAMYSSDLKRAQQTADCIARHIGAEPVLRRELRERNLGKCCGKSVQWLKENLEMQEKTVDDRLFSDAESHRDVWNRLKPFYEEILSNDEKDIIIVSHGDLLSVFQTMFMRLDISRMEDLDIFGTAGGVSHLFISDDGKHVVRRLCDMSYIL